MARININDFDDELLEKVKREATARGCTKNDPANNPRGIRSY